MSSNDESLRKAWVAKHTQVLFEYVAYCPECEAKWDMMSAEKNPETYCPFCFFEEPISIKEA